MNRKQARTSRKKLADTLNRKQTRTGRNIKQEAG